MEYKGYTSLEVIADKLLRHPMMRGISYEAIIDYSVDFMRIVQCGGFFEERCTFIRIENYKGLLPQDYFEVNQIRLASSGIWDILQEPDYGYNEDGEIVPLESTHDVVDIYGNPVYKNSFDATMRHPVFKHSGDTFHTSSNGIINDYVYKIQGNYIFTSIKEGMIEISYKAILLDEKGYPLIPDNSKFARALQAYIKKEWFTILFDTGDIQWPILQNTQQEYAWAVGACESEYQKMTIDKAESFYNSWRTMIPRTREHSKSFINNNKRENLKFS